MDLLLKNKNLNNELIKDVETIVSKLLTSPLAANINIENLSHNINTLTFKEDFSLNNRPAAYDYMTNTIRFNSVLLDKADVEFLLAKELLGLAVNKINSTNNGFTKYDELLPLDDGLRDNLAEVIVGNEAPITISDDEKVIARLFAEVYGHELVLKSFFSSNPDMLIRQMKKMQGEEATVNLLNNIKSNYFNRFSLGNSMLGEIEMQLIDVFMNKDNLSEEEVNNFELNLFTNKESFAENKDMYSSLDQVSEYFQSKKHTKQL